MYSEWQTVKYSARIDVYPGKRGISWVILYPTEPLKGKNQGFFKNKMLC